MTLPGLKEALLLGEIQPVTRGLTIQHPVEKMSVDELVTLWGLLGRLDALIAARKEQLREQLMAYAEAHGELIEPKGHRRVYVDGHEITKQHAQDKLPSEGGLRALLEAKGIDVGQAFDVVQSLELNPEKLARLVAEGTLAQADVDKLRGESYSLRVDLGPEYARAIDAATLAPEALRPYLKQDRRKGRGKAPKAAESAPSAGTAPAKAAQPSPASDDDAFL